MEERFLGFFDNPFSDFISLQRTPIVINEKHIKNLITKYTADILTKCQHCKDDRSGDLYVGNAGIAYMFWKIWRSSKTRDLFPNLDHAVEFINDAKRNAELAKRRPADRYAFLLGNAGIYAVSAVILYDLKQMEKFSHDLAKFKTGVAASIEILNTKYGCDELLVGRAGYLSGCYWLNDMLGAKIINDDEIIAICRMIIKSGRQYAKNTKAPLPLMYQYHGKEYLGAAHGLSSILHMVLDSPWFRTYPISAPNDEFNYIKVSLDYFLSLQDDLGNFPVSFGDLDHGGRREYKVQWCHGAPGVVYLLAKAYLIFGESKYLNSLERAAELVWKMGILRKGPGICHGVAGNGYVFLLLYRLTNEPKYFYRAMKYMEILTDREFVSQSRIPDTPYSLYEGVAGTVCFLIDLLEPEHAHFPFMDVFH